MQTPITATIDISPIVYGRGVSRYTTNLVRSLLKRDDIHLHVFGSSMRQLSVLQEFVRTQHISKDAQLMRIPPKILPVAWYQIGWPPLEKLLTHPTDLFHAWEELVPPTQNTPVIATIHDLAIIKFPETAHPATLAKHKAAWKRLKQSGSHVIAVSQSTKRDILELLEFEKDKVHLVYEALPEENKLKLTKEDQERILHSLHLLRPFFLYVGAIEPRKNINRLITAWKKFEHEFDLVIAGPTEWGVEIQDNSPHLRQLGRVTAQQLAALYSAASVFTFPSLYEGFGLPILEAFHYATPVLTSQNSAMSEVSGNAAMLVDPLEVESIAQGIEKLLNEKSEQKDHRKQAMKLQLQLFNWDKTAEKTVKVYEKAIEKV